MLIAILMAMTTLVNATAKTITIKVGEEYYVDLNFSSSESVTGTWSKTGNCFTFVSRGSKHCTIKGISAGTGTLSYKGVYGAYDYSTSYDVVVEPSEDSNSGTSSDATNDNDVQTDSWGNSGNYSISWYNKNDTEYAISTNKEFAGLAFLVNNGYADFKGKTVKLTADIDVSEKKWVSIGLSSTYPFRGTFDGQSHTIKVHNIEQKNDQRYYGIWGCAENATIKNVKIMGHIAIVEPIANIEYGVGVTTYPTLYIGGIVGSLNGTLYNCHCESDVSYILWDSSSGKKGVINLGGLCGYAKGSISHCRHSGTITFSEKNSSANALPYIGGLVGLSDADIEYSENLGQYIYVESSASLSYPKIGGIVGAASKDRKLTKISFCKSVISWFIVQSGYAYSTVYEQIGGIVGGVYTYNTNINVVNCYSSVKSGHITNSSTYTKWVYGGIGCVDDNSDNKANFSNSDVTIEANTSKADNISSIDGSTAFTYNQMQTPAFLEELNLYSMLEMDDGPVWTQDAEGGYPYIASLYEKPSTAVSSIVVSPSSLSLKVGEGKSIQATISPDNATDQSVTWESSNTSVATVSSDGYVQAIAEGTATITCTANDGSGASAKCVVTVTAQQKIGDVNGDGEVGIGDIIAIINIMAGSK